MSIFTADNSNMVRFNTRATIARLLLAALITLSLPGTQAETNDLGNFDGTFETDLTGSTSTGDVSLVGNLGILNAPEGVQALLLTTAPDAGSNPGDATQSSVLLDNFTIDAIYSTVRVTYNFLSSEPQPSFGNDQFVVTLVLVTAGGEEILLNSDTFDRFTDAPWTGYAGQSGFRTMVGDVSAVAGTGDQVALELRISDVGDGRGNSAVLIDDLQLAEPGIPIASVADQYVQITPGEAFLFDGSSSTDDVGVTAYEWDFNNGFFGFGPLVNMDQYTTPGFYQGTLTVTDADGNTDTATFTVVVGDPNTAPTIVSAANTAATEDVPYTYQIAVQDNEIQFGDVITYAVDAGPTGMAVDTSGLVTWTPPVGGPNTYDVTVSATDSQNATTTQSYTIAIGPEAYVAAIGDFGRVWTARSTGAGFDNFREEFDIHQSSRSRGLVIADFDGDKDPDLITSQRSVAARVELYLHERDNGGFLAPVHVGTFDSADPSYTMDMTAGDFDDDGDQDIVLNTNSARTLYFENQGQFETTDQQFFASDFESGTVEGWGGAINTTFTVDNTTAASGSSSMRVEAAGANSPLTLDINPANWFFTEGHTVSFAYRIPAGVPAGMLVNVNGFGWMQIGGTTDASPGPYQTSPEAVELIADDTWRTIEFNLYDVVRALYPAGSSLTEFQWWTSSNAQPGDQFWFDDFEVTRPTMTKGFIESLVPDTGSAGRGLDTGDINGDGILDFVRARSDATLYVYTGDGTGAFTASTSVGDVGNDAYGLVADDFNNDGIDDLIGNNNGSGDTLFLQGNGDGTFQAGVAVPNLDYNFYASFGARDMDGDGNVDVVVSTYNNQRMYFNRGNGDGTFQPGILIGATSGSNVLAVAVPEGQSIGRPYAIATADTQTTPTGDTVNFDGTGSYDDGTITSYDWDFGNGETASGATASTTFANEGQYTVILTVTDDEGNIDRQQVIIQAQGTAPVAEPGGPYTFDENAAVQGRWRVMLNGTGSSDAESSIAKYEWDLDASDGLGIDSTSPFPRWTYLATGVYTVTLTVEDQGGLRTTTSTTVTIAANDPPVAAVTGDATLDENNASLSDYYAWFSLETSADDVGIQNYTFDWGDGAPTTTVRPMADNFDDGNINGWITSGTIGVVDGEAQISDTGAAWRWLQDVTRAYEDFQLEVEFQALPNTADGYVGIAFRNANSNFSRDSFLVYARDSWDTWSLYDWTTDTTLQQGGAGWDEGIWYKLRLVVVGDTMELYVTPQGGTESLAVTTTNAAHPRGGIALLSFNQTVRYDNLKVTPLDANWTQNGLGLSEYAHRYDGEGSYDVTLDVRDHANQTTTEVVTVTAAPNDPPVADAGGPYQLNETDASFGDWTLTMDLTASTDDVEVERYIIDFGDGTSYTTGAADGTAASFFATGTDLYGFDTPDGNIARVIATQADTFVELVNLDTGRVIASTTLANPLSTWNNLNTEGAGYYKIRANRPVTALFGDFSNGMTFHPAMNGTPVGREFFAYFDLNLGIYAYAYEDAQITAYNSAGGVVFQTSVTEGEYAQLGIANNVYRIVSSGNISIQNTANDAFTAVPANSGDGAGQLFMFATTRAAGGSIAVFGQEAANFEIYDLDTGQLLYTDTVAQGDVWFRHPVGERRVRLVSDADVAVWAGDNEGGTGIQNLGDDLTFASGRQGTEFRIHELIDGFVVFATNDGTTVTVNGTNVATLDMDDYLHLRPADLTGGTNGVHFVQTSQPVAIQVNGFANVLNNENTYIGGSGVRHRYDTAGTYTVSVTAVDRGGQTNTATTTVDVLTNDVPVADLSAPAVADESFADGGLWSVDFDAGASTDDFGIATYDWDFGDGNTGSGAQFTHQYTTPGDYTVSLTVTDHAGQSVTVTQQVSVTLGDAPTANAGGPYVIGEEGASQGIWEVEFDGTASSDDAGIFDYSWDFGTIVLDDFSTDGEPNSRIWSNVGATKSGGTLQLTGVNSWTARGFWSQETTQRSDGMELRGQVLDAASNGVGRVMWGAFLASPSGLNFNQMPHAIYFDNGAIRIYELGANRGTTGTYTRGVLYDVRIVLRDVGAEYYMREAGTTTWTDITPTTSASTNSELRIGATVNFGLFEFDTPTFDPLRKSGPIVTRTYFNPITNAPVSLTVRDNALQADTDNTTLTIEQPGEAPVANAGADITVEVNSFVNFNGTNSTDDVEIERYEWNFGEFTGGPDAPGSETANLPYTSKGPTPRHFYKTPGVYTAELTVFDRVNQSNTDTVQVTVVVADPPVASAVVARPGAANGPPTYFDAGASTDDFGIVEYRWDFDAEIDTDGDGDPTNDIQATGRTPFWTFPSPTGGNTPGFILNEPFDGPVDAADWTNVGLVVENGVGTIEGNGIWGSRYLRSTEAYGRVSSEFQGEFLQQPGTARAMVGVKNTTTNASFNQMPHAIYFDNGILRIYENGSNRGTVNNFTYDRDTWYQWRIEPVGNTANYYLRERGENQWTLLTGFNPLNITNETVQIHTVVLAGTTQLDNMQVVIPEDPTITLTVVDGAGQTSSTTLRTTVALSAPPHVITVPWVAFDPLVPHETFNGKAITLKGIVRDSDPVTYQWDYGDGNQSPVLNVTDPYDLGVTYTYPAAPSGTPFTATLTVTDAEGNTGSATYPVIVKPENLTTEINVAIDEGLWYLHTEQTRGTVQGFPGGWWTSNARPAATASSIQAFEVNGHLETIDHQTSPYAETVERGFRQLFADLNTFAIAAQTYGQPDTNGNGQAIQTGAQSGGGGQPIYQGGQVMDAIASSGAPLTIVRTGPADIVGRTYFDILQDMTDAYAWGQTEQGVGGGWRYAWNSGIDNSAAQWGAIGLLAARDIFGIPYPEWVKERNLVWLANSQQSGAGFGYTGASSTAAGTPSGMVQLIMNDVDKYDQRWESAERWMADNWLTQYIITPGNRPYYPYYALTKAMRLAQPEASETFLSSGLDWFRDEDVGLARTLVDDQLPNGQFPGTTWISNQLRSAWGVIILSRTLFVQPPVADAGRDRVWGVDVPLDFDASNSFHLDPFRDIVLYEWDFDGDGTFDFASDQPFATYTYTSTDYPEATLPVTINARLRVTDNNVPPLTDNDTVEIIVAIPPHPPVAEAAGPYTCTAGIPCPLDGSGSFDIDPTDFIFRYEWDLDGFPFEYTGATGETPAPVFAEGLHNIGLRVYDNGVLNDLDGDGEVDENERLTDVDFTTVTAVANLPPVADAAGPYVVDEGSVVALDGTGSSDPNGDPLVYQWDLDDDGLFDDALGATVNYIGVDDGAYPIALRVTDSLLDSIAVATVTVNNVAPTVEAGPDTTAIEGSALTFAGSFTDPGTLDTHTIEWDSRSRRT